MYPWEARELLCTLVGADSLHRERLPGQDTRVLDSMLIDILFFSIFSSIFDYLTSKNLVVLDAADFRVWDSDISREAVLCKHEVSCKSDSFKLCLHEHPEIKHIKISSSCFSFSGDIQDPPGQGPVQPALGDPASAGGLDWVTHRGPFQPQPFCDSVIFFFSSCLSAEHQEILQNRSGAEIILSVLVNLVCVL